MIRAFIFDLGNVLIKIAPDNIYRTWAARSGQDLREIREKFLLDPIHDDLERGTVTPAQFYQHIRTRYNLPLSDAALEEGWNAIFDGLVPGIEGLLRDLSEQYRLVVLSNTNEPHVRFFAPVYREILGRFERIFYSNEIGCRKPEPEAYRTVLDYLQVKPEEAVFFDDKTDNILAAREAGIIGIQFTTAQAALTELKKLGIDLEKAS